MPKRLRNAAKRVGKAAGRAAKGAVNMAKPAVNAAARQIIPALTKSIIDKTVTAIAGGFVPGPKLGGRRPMALTNAPAAFGSAVNTGTASMRMNGGGTRVVHREYLGDIGARANTFDLQYQFGVNPGNASFMPWCSKIANNFDSYSFNRLSFIFLPVCGTNTEGVVTMAIDYDSSDTPPTSQQQMLNYKGAVQTNAWKPATMTCSSADLHKLKTHYILTGVPPKDTDIKTYDVGNFFLAVNTQTVGATFGQLFVEYDVTLTTPQTVNEVPCLESAGVLTLSGSPTLIVDVAATATTTFRGPLGAYVVASSTPYVYDVYLPTAGYYQITFAQEESVIPDTIQWGTTAMQQPLFLRAFTSTSTTQAEVNQIAVATTSMPAFQFISQMTYAPELDNLVVKFYLSVLPIGESVLVNPDFSEFTARSDPRRRFGLIPRP